MNIYKLVSILDDPRYEGFAAKYGIVPISYPRSRTTRRWRVRRLASTWIPLKVIGRVRAFNDFPGLSGHLAFSQRAIDALTDLLDGCVELLPLSTSVGAYFMINVTKVADVVDWKHSDVHWIRKPIRAMSFARYQFFARKLDGLTIFRIPEQPLHTYVTETFASRVREADLRGCDLMKVWPLPTGVSWLKSAKEEREKREAMELPTGQQIKGQSVELLFPLKESAPTPIEQRKAGVLKKEIDNILTKPDHKTPMAPAIGSFERYRFGPGKELRIQLSCPDAQKLIEILRPWLISKKWSSPPAIIRRYGNFADVEAREERVNIRMAQKANRARQVPNNGS